jgi:hypothetical protein
MPDNQEVPSSGSSISDEPQQLTTNSQMTKRKLATVFILCFINLINYMDRMTIAGGLKALVPLPNNFPGGRVYRPALVHRQALFYSLFKASISVLSECLHGKNPSSIARELVSQVASDLK